MIKIHSGGQGTGKTKWIAEKYKGNHVEEVINGWQGFKNFAKLSSSKQRMGKGEIAAIIVDEFQIKNLGSFFTLVAKDKIFKNVDIYLITQDAMPHCHIGVEFYSKLN